MTDVFASNHFSRLPQDSSYYSIMDNQLDDHPHQQQQQHLHQQQQHQEYIQDQDSNRSQDQKTDGKQQATFLTKLYALLERPEYQHMIRWDAKGEQIIVERPEQLALHVLPSIYRQSRFASFSRQLNIYGFMRKVNLRNVDPAIDDPDASTWSHPTLNRNSPPDVVANFKRRVPPRVPKTRKRDAIPEPAVLPKPNPAVKQQLQQHYDQQEQQQRPTGRPRGYSSPQPHMASRSASFFQQPNAPSYQLQPLSTVPSSFGPSGINNKFGSAYGRGPLPPLTISNPDFPFNPSSSYSAFPSISQYSQQNGPHRHPITPTDDPQHHFAPSVYQPSGGIRNDVFGFSYPSSDTSSAATSPVGAYGAQSAFTGHQSSWASSGYHPTSQPLISSSSGGSASVSSLLNPGGHYARQAPNAASYPSPFAGIPAGGNYPQQPASPDDGNMSRPTTGYSVSSSSAYTTASGAYSPGSNGTIEYGGGGGSRPSSSSGLSIRRPRGRSDAYNAAPYPSPHASQRLSTTAVDQRPVTAPGLGSYVSNTPQGAYARPSLNAIRPATSSSSLASASSRSPAGSPGMAEEIQRSGSPQANFAYSLPSLAAPAPAEFAYTVHSAGSSTGSGEGAPGMGVDGLSHILGSRPNTASSTSGR